MGMRPALRRAASDQSPVAAMCDAYRRPRAAADTASRLVRVRRERQPTYGTPTSGVNAALPQVSDKGLGAGAAIGVRAARPAPFSRLASRLRPQREGRSLVAVSESSDRRGLALERYQPAGTEMARTLARRCGVVPLQRMAPWKGLALNNGRRRPMCRCVGDPSSTTQRIDAPALGLTDDLIGLGELAQSPSVHSAVAAVRELLGMELAFSTRFVDGQQVVEVLRGDAESFGVDEGFRCLWIRPIASACWRGACRT